jgi:hypothetical protein
MARDCDMGRDGEPIFWFEGDRGMSADTTFLDILTANIIDNVSLRGIWMPSRLDSRGFY